MAGIKNARLLIILIIFGMIFSAAAGAYIGAAATESCADRFANELNGRFGAILACTDEKLHEQLAMAYTGEYSEEDIQRAEAVLGKFGYGRNMPHSLFSGYSDDIKRTALLMMITSLSSGLIILLLCVLMFSAYAKKLREISDNSEKITFGRKYSEDGTLSGTLRRCSSAFARISEHNLFLENKLSRQNEYIHRLISDISHQMKTPVAALRINTEIMLSDNDMPRSIAKDFLSRDLSELDRLEWLIAGLLKSARLDSGETEFEMELSGLREMSENAVSMFSEQIEKKGICVKNCIPEDIVIEMDRKWLTEAVGNLIKNSVEHTPSGGCIELYGEETPLTAVMSVKDNGCGISPEIMPKIFDRFFSAGKKDSASNSVGIGLAITKSIIERHNGNIRVSSDGSGTVFTITFLKGTL